MVKKIFALVLCAALTAAVFMGCGNNKKPASSSSSSSSASSSMANSGTQSVLPDSSSDSLMGDSGMTNSTSGSMMPDSGMTNSTSGTNSGMNSAAAPAAADFAQLWNLRLVSAESPLPEGFSVDTRAIKGYENRQFDTRAADALEQMLAAAEKAGMQLYLVSAYRSTDRQDALFRRKVQSFVAEGFDQQEAEKQAARWVARPFTSEHNLGLAADIVSADWYSHNSDLTAAFENTPHFTWLQQNCAAYGFILRYPAGKEDLTGVTYEPWHYRYVGVQAAKAIMDSGLTLEEYVKQHPVGKVG